jgi:hypothetical protein
MKTTATKMSIFVFMVITTTTLTLGTPTAMATSKTHTDIIQLKNSGDDWFPTPTATAVSNIHTHHHNMHLMSSNGNDLAGTNGISNIGSRNNDFLTGWVGGFSPTQYGSTVSHSYHHHIPTGTIVGINGANRGFGGNDDIPTGWAFNN